MSIKTIILLLALITIFPLTWRWNQPALIQKPTFQRLIENPVQALGKILSRLDCGIQSADATIQAHVDTTDPSTCSCTPPFTNSAEAWNNCVSCFFIALAGVYNTFATTFSLAIDPDLNLNSTITLSDEEVNVVSSSSSLAAYERQTTLSDADGNICLSIFYTKHDNDSSRVKGLFHIDTSECPGTDFDSGYAMVMIFDTKYTDENVQSGELMAAINPDGTYDLTSGDDQLFYSLLDIDESSGTTITTSHTYILAANTATKFYITGQDDTLLFGGTVVGVALTDTTVDGSDLTTDCTDDSDNSDAGAPACASASYALSDFPFTVNSIKDVIYPDWTTDSLSVSSTDIESYFAP